MESARVRRRGLAAVAALAALLLAAPPPAQGLALLHAPPAADPVAPVVAAVALAAWALAAWLAVACGLVLLARVPGPAGRLASRACAHLAPVALRRTVEVALGLAVTVAVAGSGPAALAAPSPGPGTAGAAVQAAEAPPGEPASLDWPGSPAPPAPADAGGAGDAVVVQPGDSLWRLAAADLQRHAGVAPSAARTAAAWPRWWEANREAVGDDPDLILPGTVLRPPASTDAVG